MSEWTIEARKEVVKDLTRFFNTFAKLQSDKEAAPEYRYKKNDHATLMFQVTGEFATIVDFHVNATLYASTIKMTLLGSAELAAIMMMHHLYNRGLLDTAVPVMYDVMQETSKINGVPFHPVFKPAR